MVLGKTALLCALIAQVLAAPKPCVEFCNTLQTGSYEQRSGGYGHFQQGSTNLKSQSILDTFSRPGNWTEQNQFVTDGGHGKVYEERGQYVEGPKKIKYYKQNYSSSYSSGSPSQYQFDRLHNVDSTKILNQQQIGHESRRNERIEDFGEQIDTQRGSTGIGSQGVWVPAGSSNSYYSSHYRNYTAIFNQYGLPMPTQMQSIEQQIENLNQMRRQQEQSIRSGHVSTGSSQYSMESGTVDIQHIQEHINRLMAEMERRFQEFSSAHNLQISEITHVPQNVYDSSSGTRQEHIEAHASRGVSHQTNQQPDYRPSGNVYGTEHNVYQQSTKEYRIPIAPQETQQTSSNYEMSSQQRYENQRRAMEESQRREYMNLQQSRRAEQISSGNMQHRTHEQYNSGYPSGSGHVQHHEQHWSSSERRGTYVPSETVHREHQTHSGYSRYENAEDSSRHSAYGSMHNTYGGRSSSSQQYGMTAGHLVAGTVDLGSAQHTAQHTADCDETVQQAQYNSRHTRLYKRDARYPKVDDSQQRNQQVATFGLSQQKPEKLTQQSEDLTQQTGGFDDFSQQSGNLEFGQQSQHSGHYTQQSEDLTQQTGGFDDFTQQTSGKLEFGQQTQQHPQHTQHSGHYTQQSEDLTQQTGGFDDLTQQTSGKLEFGQQTQQHPQQTQPSGHYSQQSEDLTQQTGGFDDLTQQTSGKLEFGQQTQQHPQQTQPSGHYSQQSEDLTQQTGGFDDFTQQTSGNLEFGQQTQHSGHYTQQTQQSGHHTQQTEDLTQQTGGFNDFTQQTSGNLEFGQQTQHSGHYTQQTQQSGHHTQQSEDLTQQTGGFDDFTQQTSGNLEFGQQNQHSGHYTQQSQHSGHHNQQTQHSGHYSQQSEDLTQQTGGFDDFTQQTSGKLEFGSQTSGSHRSPKPDGSGHIEFGQSHQSHSYGHLEVGNHRVQDLSQQNEGLTQQTGGFGDFTQQTSGNLEFGQQRQQRQPGRLTQQTEDLTQQTGGFNDFSQQTSGNLEFGQRTQHLGHSTQETEDMTQQSGGYNDFSQQTAGHIEFGQQSQYPYNTRMPQVGNQRTPDYSQQTGGFGNYPQQQSGNTGYDQYQHNQPGSPAPKPTPRTRYQKPEQYGGDKVSLNNGQSTEGIHTTDSHDERGDINIESIRNPYDVRAEADVDDAKDEQSTRGNQVVQNSSGYGNVGSTASPSYSGVKGGRRRPNTAGYNWHVQHNPGDLSYSPQGQRSQNPVVRAAQVSPLNSAASPSNSSPANSANQSESELKVEPRILEAYGGGPYDASHSDDIFSNVTPHPSATLPPYGGSDPWDIREKPRQMQPVYVPETTIPPRELPEMTTQIPETTTTFWNKIGNKITSTFDKAKEKARDIFG